MARRPIRATSWCWCGGARRCSRRSLRAPKRRGVPVAGADRLSLSAHIVFDDLLALGRFCLFPDDDLTLAALLKSPFCGLSDDDLYALAKGRPGTLWKAVNDRAAEQPAWFAARDLLRWALAESRRKQPFEFYAFLLGRVDDSVRSNRAKVLTRLGEEAAEALDEFLAQHPGRRAARGARPGGPGRRLRQPGHRRETRDGGRAPRGAGDDRPRLQGPGGADRLPARDHDEAAGRAARR